jgi:hypothetical protein
MKVDVEIRRAGRFSWHVSVTEVLNAAERGSARHIRLNAAGIETWGRSQGMTCLTERAARRRARKMAQHWSQERARFESAQKFTLDP